MFRKISSIFLLVLLVNACLPVPDADAPAETPTPARPSTPVDTATPSAAPASVTSQFLGATPKP